MLGAKSQAYRDFIAAEERERHNPNNMLIRIVLICAFGFYKEESRPRLATQSKSASLAPDWQDLRRLYVLILDRGATVYLFRKRLESEFQMFPIRIFAFQQELTDS